MRTKWPEVLVHHVRIGKYRSRFRILGEPLFHARNLVRIPYVILVAQKDDVAATGAYGCFKVAGRPKPFGVYLEPYRKRRGLCEFLHNGRSRVGGSIVENNQLVRQPRLLKQALQLL